MQKTFREGGILPPFSRGFPPFAYGAGQALSAVGKCNILINIEIALLYCGITVKKMYYFSTFSTFCLK